MKHPWVLLTTSVLATAPHGAKALVLGFDDLPVGTVVRNEYPPAEFSSISGYEVRVQAGLYGAQPRFVCTAAVGGAPSCMQPLSVRFSTPVINLRFTALEPNEYGPVATIAVTTANGPTEFLPLIGLGQSPGGFAPGNVLVDLSGFGSIARIEILPPPGRLVIDNAYVGSGIGYDNFTFDAVPLPNTSITAGIGMLTAIRRKRR